MADVGRHPNVKLLSYSEVKEIRGFIGNFQVKVLKHARYVNEKDCTACDECAKVCPVSVPDEFNLGLNTRKAIYKPFPQAVPSAYLVDMKSCLGNKPLVCAKCQEACEKKCINFDLYDEELELQVGTIITATGLDVYDPTPLDEFGYARFENVITSLEFERLIAAGGPSDGHLVRLTDRQIPKTVAFIQCVGSRCEQRGNSAPSSLPRGNPYCSNVCCMNTVKDTLLIKDHWPEMECQVFYMDMRTFGKGFEDLYKRSKSAGVKFIRGIPGAIREDPKTKNLILTVENTTANRIETHEVEMLVLSVGVQPQHDSDVIKKLLNLSKTSDGFFMEAHPKLQPVDAPTKGVFLAGCAEAPKDIKDSVTQASAAAARANVLMHQGKIKVEAITSRVDTELCKSCGICVKVCPYHAISVDKEKKTGARVAEAACGGCGTCGAECPFGAITMRHFEDAQIKAQIEAMLEEAPQDKIVVFACNWCSYAGGDGAGVARLQYPPNARLIRTMCSGRVSEQFVLHAFKLGAPIVLLSGCHLADCHYINANHWTLKRVEKLWDKLEKKGIRPERFQLEWISSAEGPKFARVMTELEALRQKVTKEEIAQTIKVLSNDKK